MADTKVAPKTKGGSQGEVPNVDQKTIDTLLKRFKEAELAVKNKYRENWDKSKKYYDGDMWDDIEKLAWYQSEPGFNKQFEFVEIMRAYLSDNKWGIDVFPVVIPDEVSESLKTGSQLTPTQEMLGITPEQEIEFMADKINKLLDFLWVDQRMSLKLAEVLLFVFLYGTGFIKTSFDPAAVTSSGVGQIETKVLSPRYIFPDPEATSVQDASFIIEHHPVTFRWILERYPAMAEEVKKKGLNSTTEHNEAKGTRPAGAADNEEAKRVDIYECWYYDSSLLEEDDAETGQKAGEAAYPNGRMTLMTSTGVVLEDKPNPYTMFPYIRFIEIPRPAEFFGDATVWRAFPIQDTINQILRAIIDNGLWMSHGVWVIDSTSGVTPEMTAEIAPRDSLVKNPGSEVERRTGESVPGGLFQTLEQQVTAYDRVVGLPDVLRGIVPGRQPVGTTQMQKEAGDVRTRERQRRVEEALQDLGQLWLDIVAEYWSDTRVFHGKRLGGGLEMFQMNKADLAEWKWTVQVIPGSTTSTDTDALLERAMKLRVEAGVMLPDSYMVEVARLPGAARAMMVESGESAGANGAPDEVPAEAGVEPLPPEGAPEQAAPDEALMGGGAPPGALPPDLGGGQLPPEALMQA